MYNSHSTCLVGSYSILRNYPFQDHGRTSEKLKKNYYARSNPESRVAQNPQGHHKDHWSARQEGWSWTLGSSVENVFRKLVLKTEELFDFASKTENADSIYLVLEQWLEDVTNNNDKFLLTARSYAESFVDRYTVCEGVNPQSKAKKSSCLITSTMSSKR